ncbi:hypothetical protein HN873_039500 [Arachis hypogaea]
MLKVKVYADRMSQPSRAVLIFCKVNGIEFNEIKVEISKRQQLSPEFAAINPFKKLPAIVDGRFKLFESHVILIYLASAFPGIANHWLDVWCGPGIGLTSDHASASVDCVVARKNASSRRNLDALVFRTVGFSGADIRNLVNEAAIMMVRKGHSKISHQDIVDVLEKQLLEGMGVLLIEEEQQKCEESVSVEKKRLLAVH